MHSACTVCGERYPSTYYFAKRGLCKTCHAASAAPGALPDTATPSEHPTTRSFLTERGFWLGVGGNVTLILTVVLAFAELFAVVAGSSLFLSRVGAAEGAIVFLIGLLSMALVLAIGFAVAAAFFTLRALDDDLRRRAATKAPSTRD